MRKRNPNKRLLKVILCLMKLAEANNEATGRTRSTEKEWELFLKLMLVLVEQENEFQNLLEKSEKTKNKD